MKCWPLLVSLVFVACDPAPPVTMRTDSSRSDGGGGTDSGDGDPDVGTADTSVDAPVMDVPLECVAPGSCDPFARVACPPAESCRPSAEGEFRCVAIERDPFALGEACTTAASCEAGLLCLDFGDGFRCLSLCREGSMGECPDGFSCSGGLGVECAQVCRPTAATCDILMPDCAAGEACAPTFDPETDDPITACRAAGPRGLGEDCDSGAANACQAGLVCIRTGDTNVCRQVCDADADACPAPLRCIGSLAMWSINYCS